MVKESCGIRVIAMVRPRGAGFCYGPEDFLVIERDCRLLVEHGADGIAFGCLNSSASVDEEQNRRLISIIHEHGKEAVFHRAFDCTDSPFETIEKLIHMGVDRVLTSGLKPTAMEGLVMIKELQRRYGNEIEILAGSGVNASNARKIMEETGISQVHSSCKEWKMDLTTAAGDVNYSYASSPNELCYDAVSAELVRKLLASIGE
ncbi:copper homeostasis protein CutC [Clostridium sp. AM58-1XD]|uniref:copper homeostasis protein CutC n=1 Tax=Clostridium sp. AM58-1XD TaxID=2292307 RepID=UPI00325AE8BA